MTFSKQTAKRRLISGAFLSLIALGFVSTATAAAPVNDIFANASTLAGESGQVTGTNREATLETGEPDNNGGKSVWWTWTAPATELIVFTTNQSSYDTVMGIYTGESVDALTVIAEDDDSGQGNKSSIEFSAQAGTTYRISVDGRDGRSGDIVLTYGDYVPPAPFTVEFIDTDMGEWLPSGQDSGPENPFDPASPNDVDTTKSAGVVEAIVRASPANSGRQKIVGWYHNNVVSADVVGAGKWVRGKFYIYTNRPFSDNLNTVSNFRIRLQNEGAVLGGMNYEYAQTGGGASYEPIYALVNNSGIETSAGQFLRPSADALKPSLYRADLDPVDVPALAGTRVWATFESFSFVSPSDCILSLTEFVAGTYSVPQAIDGSVVFEYDRALGAAAGLGGAKTISFAGFNTDANIEAGRRPDLKYPGLDPSDPYSSALVPFGSESTGSTGGIVIDSSPTPSDLFGIGIVQVYSELASPSDNPRLQLDKLYHARYYVTSALPTTSANVNDTIFSQVQLRVQTAGSAATAFLFFNGPANSFNPLDATKAILSESLPGNGSQNPDTDPILDTAGEDGGWYSVVMNSPWNTDIRQDGNTFGTFVDEPGFGVDASSMKDITLGVDIIKLPRTLKFGPPPFHAIAVAQPNDASVRVSKIEVIEYTDVDDGGYSYN